MGGYTVHYKVSVSYTAVSRRWVWSKRRVLDERDPGTRLVDVPDIETFVLIKTLLKLIRGVALG